MKLQAPLGTTTVRRRTTPREATDTTATVRRKIASREPQAPTTTTVVPLEKPQTPLPPYAELPLEKPQTPTTTFVLPLEKLQTPRGTTTVRKRTTSRKAPPPPYAEGLPLEKPQVPLPPYAKGLPLEKHHYHRTQKDYLSRSPRYHYQKDYLSRSTTTIIRRTTSREAPGTHYHRTQKDYLSRSTTTTVLRTTSREAPGTTTTVRKRTTSREAPPYAKGLPLEKQHYHRTLKDYLLRSPRHQPLPPYAESIPETRPVRVTSFTIPAFICMSWLSVMEMGLAVTQPPPGPSDWFHSDHASLDFTHDTYPSCQPGQFGVIQSFHQGSSHHLGQGGRKGGWGWGVGGGEREWVGWGRRLATLGCISAF